MELKQCAICGQFKADSEFARRSDGRADGLQAHCLDCQAEKNKRYYADRQDAIKARALARKRAIAEGTYVPSKATHSGYKRRAELPTPLPPRLVVGFGVDENEYAFLEAEATRRGQKMEQLLRELIRAAMAAALAKAEKREWKEEGLS